MMREINVPLPSTRTYKAEPNPDQVSRWRPALQRLPKLDEELLLLFPNAVNTEDVCTNLLLLKGHNCYSLPYLVQKPK